MGAVGAPKGASPLERTLAALGLAAAAAAALKYATLLLWLGLMHINTFAGVIAVAYLPHAAAVTFLFLLCVVGLLPVDRPFAPWQQRLARHISDTAHAYFPISMHCEDAAAFEAKGDKFVIGALRRRRLRLLFPGGSHRVHAGLEPHSVLPIATIAVHHGSPVLPASLEARQRAGLASSVVFRVPLVKHLWSWLGLQSVDRRNMRCARTCGAAHGCLALRPLLCGWLTRAAPPRARRRLLDEDHVVMLIPGGVQARRREAAAATPAGLICLSVPSTQECLYMEKDRETIFLRKRFGFVKMALQTGAHLLPAFAFGQSRMCVSRLGVLSLAPAPDAPGAAQLRVCAPGATAAACVHAAGAVEAAGLCAAVLLGPLGQPRALRGASARCAGPPHPRAARRVPRCGAGSLSAAALTRRVGVVRSRRAKRRAGCGAAEHLHPGDDRVVRTPQSRSRLS